MTLSKVQNRQSIRLSGFDYSQPGAYFISIVSHARECVFGEIIAGEVILYQIGEMVMQAWQSLPGRFPGIELDEFICMPNHFHGILMLDRISDPADSPHEGFGRPISGSLPTIVRSFKASMTQRYRILTGMSDAVLWQRNYYEHVIRDEKELNRIRQYIQNNPVNWALDQENRGE